MSINWTKWFGFLGLILLFTGQVNVLSADGSLTLEDELRLSFEDKSRGIAGDSIPDQYEPSGMVFGSVKLPTNHTTFKIAVETDGLVKITQEALASAGMLVDLINPRTLQLMSRGYDVAYEFVGDNDTRFEAGEYLIFYGEKFDGLRFDEQYSDYNYYWLWSNGAKTPLQFSPSVSTSNPDFSVSTTKSTIEFEEDRIFLYTFINEWVETEPDSWYWQYIIKNFPEDLTTSYEIDVPYPVLGVEARVSAEVYSRRFGTRTVDLSINDHTPVTRTWEDRESVLMTQTIPSDILNNGLNNFSVTLSNPERDHIAVNNLIIDYERHLLAQGDELFFKASNTGVTRFITRFYNENSIDEYRIWDITNPLEPTRIPSDNTQLSELDTGLLKIYAQTTPESRFIATTLNNIQEPVSIGRYLPIDLNPYLGGADWIAFADASLMTQANRLADHRQSYSGFKTEAYDVEDIINQFGYGYPNPEAIRLFLRDALANWTIPPQYVLLMGASSVNPRGLACTIPGCDGHDYASEPNLVPTYLAWVDRSLGLVPTDYVFSLLVGDDLTPDIAVGRIPAATPKEAQYVVDKVLQHEANLALEATYTDRYLFVADNNDIGGNFCQSNQNAIDFLPNGKSFDNLCYDEYVDNAQGLSEFKNIVFNDVNTDSPFIFNYRGHGSVIDWAGGLASAERPHDWQNVGQASIILSADCLDGNFGFIGRVSLGESFLIADQKRGSVAHWSSAGFGFTVEHNIMHQGFYDGMFNQGLDRIGDATNFSKSFYINNTDQDRSEAFNFNLLGDPALPLRKIATDSGDIAGVIAQSPTTVWESPLGTLVTYRVVVTNSGTAPDQFTIALSDDLANWSSTSDIVTTPTLAPGETIAVSITVNVPLNGQFFDENVTTFTVASQNDPLSTYDLPLTTIISDLVVTSVTLDTASAEGFSVIGLIVAMFAILFALTIYRRRA